MGMKRDFVLTLMTPPKGVMEMATYFMFGKYTSEAMNDMSAKRTAASKKLIKDFGGKINAMYVLLGEYDLVLIVDLPGNDEAIQASVALSKMTNIAFTTAPAVTVANFDKMIA